MKIIFSKHAENQIRERNLSKSQIISTILKSDKTLAQENQKFRAVKLIKKVKKEYLMVVIYRKTNSSIKVITAFLTTKIKKYLK